MEALEQANTTKNAVLLDIFPEATHIGRGGGEVNGLKKDVQPENCTVLLKTPSPWEDDREFYLLIYETHNLKVKLEIRICDAMEGSGYDRFAVIHKFDIIDPEITDYSDIIKESYSYRIREFKR